MIASYLIQVSICWILFYLFYYLLLRNQILFHYNRIYLLLSLITGLVLPYLSGLLSFNSELFIQYQAMINEVVIYGKGSLSTDSKSNVDYLALLYWLVFCLFFFRTLYGLYKIWSLYYNSKSIEHCSSFYLIKTKTHHLPFSFLNGIFINDSFDLEKYKMVLEHEKIHIKLMHTLDLLLLDLLHAFFWFNPIIILYKKSLKLVHEFNVDKIVTNQSDKQEYIHMLLSSTQHQLQLALCNHFFQSQISKRIHMLRNFHNQNSSRLSYLFALPLAIVLLCAMSPAAKEIIKKNTAIKTLSSFEIVDTIPPTEVKKPKANKTPPRSARTNPKESKTEKVSPHDPKINDSMIEVDDPNKVYDFVQQKPEFACDPLYAKESNCSETSMINFMLNNLKYPEEARKNNIQGRVIVKFIVDKTGKVVDPKVVRGIGGGCDEEAIKLINLMPNWIPGKHNGKNVSVTFTLPLTFKLEEPEKK